MMHTNSPDDLLQFRGDTKWSYYDNSGQIIGQPTVQCIMLNTAAEPFNNHTLRMAMAMCINRTQYAKVIDRGIDAPMSGLFLPGSEFYTKTAYPSYNPTQGAKLVKQVQQQTGKPVSFTLNSTSDPETLQAAQFLQQAFQTAGMKVSINIIAQATIINDALAGTYQATLWRQFGAVDPDLNYVWWSTQTTGPPLPLNMARNSDPRIQTALLAGRTTTDHADRVAGLPEGQRVLGRGRPLPLVGPLHLGRRGQPQGAELRQPHHAAGLQGRRLRRGRALAGPDVGVVGRLPRPPAGGGLQIASASRRRRGTPRASACSAPRGGGGSRSAVGPRRSSRSWLTATIVPGHAPSMAPTAAMDEGSRLLVGSSSSSRFASPAESIASPSLARSPPDSVAGS